MVAAVAPATAQFPAAPDDAAARRKGKKGAAGAAPTINGNWAGELTQVGSQTPYKFELTINAKGAETKYPDLDCIGKLTRVRLIEDLCVLRRSHHQGLGGQRRPLPRRHHDRRAARRQSRARLVRQRSGHHRRRLRHAEEEVTQQRDAPSRPARIRSFAIRWRPPASRRNATRGARAQARRGPRNPCSSLRRHGPPPRPHRPRGRRARAPSAINAEPVSVVTEWTAPSRHGSRGMAASAAASACAGCATKTIPSASTKRAPSASRAQASTGSQAALCRATRPAGPGAR